MTTGRIDYKLEANATGFTAEVKKASRSVDGLGKSQNKTAKSAASMGKAYAALGVGVAAIAGAGVLAFRKMVSATAAQDAAMAQLNATLASTGGVSGKTAEGLAATAAELQKVTTFGDESIIGMQSLLLTFKQIKGDNFDRTTKAVLDMSVAMGTDLKSAAIQLGKALNDPATQLSALSRSGITFTETQKDMVRAMQESGDMAGAQAFILAELESQFEGSALAARETLGGALKGLENAYGDLFEVESKTSGAMIANINELEALFASEEFQQNVQTLLGALVSIVTVAAEAVGGIAAIGREIGEAAARAVGGIAWDDFKAQETAIEGVRLQLALFKKQGREAGGQVDFLNEKLKKLESEYAANKKILEDITPKIKKKTEAVKESAKALDVEAKKNNVVLVSFKKRIKQEKEIEKLKAKRAVTEKKLAKIMDGANDQLDEMLANGEKQLDQLKFERSLVGQSEKAIHMLNAERAIGTRHTEEMREALLAQTEALYDEQNAATESIDVFSDLAGVFDSLVEGGELNFERLGESFANMLVGMQEASDGAGIDFSGGDWEAAAAQAAQAAGVATAKALHGKETTGTGAAVGAVIGAYYGGAWGAAAGASLGEAVEGFAFGQSNNGNNRGSADFNLGMIPSGEGVTNRNEWGSKGEGAANSDLALTLTEPLIELANAIGGSSAAGVITVGNNDGIVYDGKSFGKDQFAFLEVAFKDVIAGATNLGKSLQAVLLGFDGTSEEFLQFTGAMLAMDENAGLNSVTSAIEDYADSQLSLTDSYHAGTVELAGLIVNFDGSADSAIELNERLVANKDAAYAFALAIKEIGDAIQSSAEAQATSIRESVMAEDELRKKRKKERDELRAGLDQLSSPEEIQKSANRILELNRQIFDSLDEAAKKGQAESFAVYAESTANKTNGLLDVLLTDLADKQKDINEVVKGLIEYAAEQNNLAADKQVIASQQFAEYVDKLLIQGIPVTLQINTDTGEVNA